MNGRAADNEKHRFLWTDAAFDKVYHVLEFTGLLCMLTPVTFFFFAPFAPHIPLLFTLLLTMGLLFAGFGLQSLYAKICRQKRPRNRFLLSYEGEKSFSVSQTFIPFLASAGIAFLSHWFFFALLYMEAKWRIILGFDPNSALPIFGAAAVFVCLVIGLAFWFLPPERIAGAKMIPLIVGATALLPIMMQFFGQTAGYRAFCVIGYLLFLICTLLLFNQTYISRGYHGSEVSVITADSRFYNAKLMLIFLGGVVVCGFVCLAVISGVYSLVKMLVFITLYRVFHTQRDSQHYVYEDPDLAAGKMEQAVFGDHVWTEVLFYVFILIVVLALFFTIFGRRQAIRDLFAIIQAWFAEIIAFWAIAKSMFLPDVEENLNYKDEKTKLQKAAIREYQASSGRTDSYQDFLSRINAFETVEEKMAFAYRKLLSVCRGMNIPLKTSDTPREAAAKIRRSSAIGIDDITEVLELVMFAEEDVGNRGMDAVRAMCEVIKKHMF